MGSLYLVRHGQASFGSDDYDRLSPLGQRQCERLGQYWRERHQRFDAVLTGTLRRHDESYAAIADGLQQATPAQRLPGLNEYDSDAIIAALHPGPLPRPDTPERARAHFRLLREGLLGWMAGQLRPAGMTGWNEFRAGVAAALDLARGLPPGSRVLLVSSGGPIATAVAIVLGLSPEATVALNLRLRNSALTEFVVNAKRHALLSFNTLPHLDAPEFRGWETYA